MDEAMELFWEDLDSGEVHVRDKWQFTLKSEFFPKSGRRPSQYTQEFYLFIPYSLQINENTYSKLDFYRDQTTLIRYKTPEFTFAQIVDLENHRSPLKRIFLLCDQPDNSKNRSKLSDELKLLANVVRSALRREVKELIVSLNNKLPGSSADFTAKVIELCSCIRRLRELYKEAEQKYLSGWKDTSFYREMLYVDEFISYAVSHYLAGLLESIRLTRREDLEAVDNAISEILLTEKRLSDSATSNGSIKSRGGDTVEGEGLLYRYGMLNKFILDALLLATNRFSLDQQYQHWIGGFSAGVAMLIYFSLFVWLGNVFLINSAPFVVIMVICYILKDRIKEMLRAYSYLHASRWFPDYTTIIKSQNAKRDLGVIQEFFSFLRPQQLSVELGEIRRAEFQHILEAFQQRENVLFYKRIVKMNTPANSEARRYGLNIIFRFNIYKFLYKAADPSETHLTIDPETRKLVSVRLPKVYHLNLIIRSTSTENKPAVELKKLRIVIDKNGIKRIEQLSHKEMPIGTDQ